MPIHSARKSHALAQHHTDMPGKNNDFNSDFKFFEDSLKRETDRGLSLVAGSLLHPALHDLLSKVLIDDRAPTDTTSGRIDASELTHGSFSECIKKCYALGLISKHVRIQLDTIRDIRNDFAHAREPLDFNSDRMQKHVAKQFSPGTPRDHMPDNPLKQTANRDRFILAVLGVLYHLRELTSRVKGLEAWPPTYELCLMNAKEKKAMNERILRLQTRKEPPPRTWYGELNI